MSLRRWTDLFLWLVHVGLIVVTATKANTVVVEPYMDEIFHIPQAQTYCAGRWWEWDPKLTTPPGLYLPSALLTHYLRLPICSVPYLRAVNASIGITLPFLIADVLACIRHGAKRPAWAFRQSLREALSISTFPLIFFFNFLFYTDLASLCMVLLCYGQALRQRYGLSAGLGLLSLSFRQTNILWVAYIAFSAADRALRDAPVTGVTCLKDSDRLRNLNPLNLWHAMIRFLRASSFHYIEVASIILPYVPVGLAFLAFLTWNGGIVLGDKTMHVAVLHVPQMYYFAAFTAAFTAPLILNKYNLRSSASKLLGGPRRMLGSLLACMAMAWTVKHYTVVHPFVLADNRHYPFYLWRKILNVHPFARYAVIPAYLYSGSLLHEALAQAGTWTSLSFMAFIGVTALTLIPSPLIEFRYFIVPFVILRLHLRPSLRRHVLLEYILYQFINLITLGLFLFRPFRWPSEHGWQRFMW